MVIAMLLVAEEWSGGDEPARWLEWLGNAGLVVMVALLAAVLLWAWLERARYRAEGVLGPDDLAALHAELASAERRTVGEVLPVVLERSDPHPGATWLAALVFLVTGSVLLYAFLPFEHPPLLLACQLALLGLGYAIARALPGFQRLFVSEARAAATAEEQAFQEFYRHALHETRERTGILLFVSLLERRAIVLGDTGIHARVGDEQWTRTTESLLAGIRRGSLRDGLTQAIREAAEVLASHFPWTEGDRNEVPDRLIVRRE
jgi:putative membrane protein